MREELLKNAAIEANKKQAELRSEYSQEANGAINRIRYLLDAGFRPGEFVYKKSSEELFETELSFNRTFTKTARWWRIKESSLWELSEYSFGIFDYGTADWQGRRLETITGELNLKIKNPALGKRDKKCLLISVMIDDEFNFELLNFFLPSSIFFAVLDFISSASVSYTHLTLPTILLV